jgi:hypothetical protein
MSLTRSWRNSTVQSSTNSGRGGYRADRLDLNHLLFLLLPSLGVHKSRLGQRHLCLLALGY